MKIHSPGTRLGTYEIVTYSLENPIYIEYTCLDSERGRSVLLKALHPELQVSQAACVCFAQSGATWASLGTHPHLVNCEQVWVPENSDETYLVSPVTIPEKERDMPSLQAWLKAGQAWPVLQALLFTLQIVRGMKYVTQRLPGFVHGDLKPENILVGGGRLSQANVNRLRVTDFGLAAVLQADGIPHPDPKTTAIGQTQLFQGIVGTPLYLAPEQWRGEKLSPATDIYALGCILYRMLVGRHPLAGDTTPSQRDSHCTGKIRPLPFNLPESIADLTIRCLALEQSQRYQRWDELETALAAAYESTIHQPVPAPESDNELTQSEQALTGGFLRAMGNLAAEAGNVETAIKSYQAALQTGNAQHDQVLVGLVTSNLGDAYRQQGETQLAIEQHQKALALAEKLDDQTLESSALNGLGADHLQRGNPRVALQYLELALSLARKIRNQEGEMAALGNTGAVYQQMGDFRHAIQSFEQVLEIARRVGARRQESMVLTNLGGIYSSLGDDRRAIRYLEQALAIKVEIGDRPGQIASLNNLANAHRNLGDARQAFDDYNRSLEIALELGDRSGEAFALNNIGATHSNLGNLDAALKYHEQALAIFKEIGDRHSQGDCLTNLGFIYMSRRDTERAIQYSQEAIVIDRELGDAFGLAFDSFNLANLLAQQNRFREALPYAEEAAHILEKIGHPEKAPQALELANMIRAEIASSPPEATVNTIPSPPNLSQQIQQVRQDNPTLTAKMSDQEIMELFQQADQAAANDRPTAFVASPTQSLQQVQQAASVNPDFEKRSLDELIVLGQQFAASGQWQPAEQAYQVLLKKAN